MLIRVDLEPSEERSAALDPSLFILSLVASVTDGRTMRGSWPIEALVAIAIAASSVHFARVVWIIRKLLAVSA